MGAQGAGGHDGCLPAVGLEPVGEFRREAEAAEQPEGEHVGLFAGERRAGKPDGAPDVAFVRVEQIGGENSCLAHRCVPPELIGELVVGAASSGQRRDARNLHTEYHPVRISCPAHGVGGDSVAERIQFFADFLLLHPLLCQRRIIAAQTQHLLRVVLGI